MKTIEYANFQDLVEKVGKLATKEAEHVVQKEGKSFGFLAMSINDDEMVGQMVGGGETLIQMIYQTMENNESIRIVLAQAFQDYINNME